MLNHKAVPKTMKLKKMIIEDLVVQTLYELLKGQQRKNGNISERITLCKQTIKVVKNVSRITDRFDRSWSTER